MIADDPQVVEARVDAMPAAQPASGPAVDVLFDVTLQLTVELGRTQLPIREVLRLGPGAVVELGKQAGDPVDILANDKLIARGELVVVDSVLAVRITELAGAATRGRS